MKLLKIFTIISIFIITIFTLASKPTMHKHFIFEASNFKLPDIGYLPGDYQTYSLFKIGNAKRTRARSNKNSKSKNSYSEEDVYIIPSSYAVSEEVTTETTTSNKSDIISSNTEDAKLSEEVADIVEGRFSNDISDSELISKALEEAKARYGDGTNTRQNSSAENSDIFQNKSCPICEENHKNSSKYRDEMIAWNIWRSNLQNRIMDDSVVEEADYGTIFYFTFKVDKNRKVSDVKVVASNKSGKACIPSVRNAILRLNGKSILDFPKGTNRTKVDFSGGFMLGLYAQYSSPSDYNDYEHVRINY